MQRRILYLEPPHWVLCLSSLDQARCMFDRSDIVDHRADHWKPTKPCPFLNCPNSTELTYYYDSNRCLCKPKIDPLWPNDQAKDQVVEHSASVYSVQPYFLDDVISFQVQLAGAPDGFNLNASTTIPASSIDTSPEPNLILVPKNTKMKTKVLKAAEESALIIAVTFDPGDSITYHVQISNGTVIKLHGDKYVHDIDLIDPSEPPSLSILPSDAWSEYEGADPSIRAAPLIMTKRGIEGISSYTATFSEETCRSITCRNNGGGRPFFNPYLKTCYCKTLDPPTNSLNSKVKRSLPDDRGFPRKPSSEACRHMTTICQGESEPYLDETSGQCYCVVYRAGVKEPVIASDTTFWPRTEHLVRQEEESDNSENFAELPTCAMNQKHPCMEWGSTHCPRGNVGLWEEVTKSCTCTPIHSNPPLWPQKCVGSPVNTPNTS